MDDDPTVFANRIFRGRGLGFVREEYAPRIAAWVQEALGCAYAVPFLPLFRESGTAAPGPEGWNGSKSHMRSHGASEG